MKKNNQWGYIDKDNNFRSPANFSPDHLENFHESLALYESQKKS